MCMNPCLVSGASLDWMGHTWTVTTGDMAGNNTGSASDVAVDSSGYLHLRISQTAGKWYCAELFSDDPMGFGTYQWQIDGAIDRMDRNIVLGLFPYGPQAGIGVDGTNEIDIEYSRWGNASWPDGNYTVYPNSGTQVRDTTFEFGLGGSTLATATLFWSQSSVKEWTQSGLRALGDSGGILGQWVYAPTDPATDLPQRAMPLGMNLWLCDGCGGAPGDGNRVEVVIRKFVQVPAGSSAIRTESPRSAAAAPSFQFVDEGGVVHLGSEAESEGTMTVLDVTGRVAATSTFAKGARSAMVPGLPRGLYSVRIETTP